jgi:hypothetical protein
MDGLSTRGSKCRLSLGEDEQRAVFSELESDGWNKEPSENLEAGTGLPVVTDTVAEFLLTVQAASAAK